MTMREDLIKRLKSELAHWKASAEDCKNALTSTKYNDFSSQRNVLIFLTLSSICVQRSTGHVRTTDQLEYDRRHRRVLLRGSKQRWEKGEIVITVAVGLKH
jgi:hypothetical protein